MFQISSFSNIGHSFVKTMTMVTGELGFECLFNLEASPAEYSPIPYYVSGFIMWIMFLILVPIILNNMLVRRSLDLVVYQTDALKCKLMNKDRYC